MIRLKISKKRTVILLLACRIHQNLILLHTHINVCKNIYTIYIIGIGTCRQYVKELRINRQTRTDNHVNIQNKTEVGRRGETAVCEKRP